ncbi:MAG: molybdopterin molybdotransferase MoeA [Synergistes sp.]|nr:molybdopterin molybdotransferase MoeA [Synergistes sp.]
MAGFVKEVTGRNDAIENISHRLSFPWDCPAEERQLADAAGRRCAKEILNEVPYPPYSRSLRDGYAVRHADAAGASSSTPLFLTEKGSVAMGEVPEFRISGGEAASIPTGGILPEGSDAVVMLEDTDVAGGWVEIRRAVQAGENIIKSGEDIAAGARLIGRGEMIDLRTVGLLASAGISSVPTVKLNISLLSTGDEIVPADTAVLRPGQIRDVNGWNLKAMLSRFGFASDHRGIVSDCGDEFERRFYHELDGCDVLVLSGGSSVGVRDHAFRLLSSLPEPGLLVRGINIVPGKPTLIAADAARKKLVVSLPGHPLSCTVAAFTVLLPLLLRLIGAAEKECGTRLMLPVASDLAARTGAEKFFACRLLPDGRTEPAAAKSGYISALSNACGFIRMPEDRETIRAGEEAEVWLWQ